MNQQTSRVIVVLNSLKVHHRALEIGVQIAARKQLSLTAVVVESVELRYAAELPFVREIDRLSGSPLPFEPPQLERLLNRQIEEIRKWLAEAQSRFPVPTRLEILQGGSLETALTQTAAEDLLLITTPHPWQPRYRRPPVWVWLDDPNQPDSLALAVELAGSEGSELKLAAPEEPPPDLLPEASREVCGPENFLDLLDKQGCSLVVCSRNSPLAKRLSSSAPCPVLLI